jgi:hypothetical protein
MPYINQNHPEHGAFAAPQPGIAEHFVEIYTPPTAVVADWEGFRQWRRQNPDYLALMGGPHGGLVGFLEADISRGIMPAPLCCGTHSNSRGRSPHPRNSPD